MSDFKSIIHRFIPKPERVVGNEMLTVRWDYKGHQMLTGRLNHPSAVIAGSHYLQHEWNNTLVTRINECRNWLYTQINEGIGSDIFDFNIITSSPSCVMVFDSMPSLLIQQHSEMTNPQHIGILGGRYVVSMDSDITEDRVYLGTQDQPKLACIIIDRLGL